MPDYKYFIDRRDVWHRLALKYQIAGAAAIALSILASLTVTTFTADLSGTTIKILSLTAAFLTGLIARFDPYGEGRKFRRAWSLLDDALVRALANPAVDQTGVVADAMKAGQSLVDSEAPPAPRVPTQKPVVPNPPGSPPP